MTAHSADPVPNTQADPQRIAEAKRAMRKRMLAMRLVADQKEGPNAAMSLMRTALAAAETIGIGPGTIVAGTWQIGTEIDVRPLLARFDAAGAVTALPVVVADDAPLAFRRWRPTDPIVEGDRSTFQPTDEAALVIPDVVLTPLLAADRRGYRLGRGGGYYDRTLAALRAVGTVTAVGLCFGVQVVDAVPHNAHDVSLDWLITENEALRIGPADRS